MNAISRFKRSSKGPDRKSNKKSNQISKTPELFEETIAQLPTHCPRLLKEVRALILDVQTENPEIGKLSEVLRWGQLIYLTEQTGSGSMIQIGLSKSGKPAMFFHCGTTLIETFQSQYTHLFGFESNRALLITEPVNDIHFEFKHCICQASTYKLCR